jgi:predicted RNA-binding protein YlqC (UPF0109 family)
MVTGFLDENKNIPISIETRFNEIDKIIMIDAFVADSKVGRAIGKDGKTARAIATILKNLAAMYGVKIAFEVLSIEKKEAKHGLRKTGEIEP